MHFSWKCSRKPFPLFGSILWQRLHERFAFAFLFNILIVRPSSALHLATGDFAPTVFAQHGVVHEKMNLIHIPNFTAKKKIKFSPSWIEMSGLSRFERFIALI